MKRFAFAAVLSVFAAHAALAADLPPPVAPPSRAPATYVPVVEPVFNWTGIYFGINSGYGFGDSNWSSPGLGSTGNFTTSGFLVGATVGGNYQFGSFVVGLEGDLDWSNLNGSTNSAASSCGVGCETKSDWLGTGRARVGWAWDRILFYGTGGAAFGNIQAAAGVLPFASTTQIGWTAGAGIEAAFARNWTARIEYLYVDLGNMSCGAGNCSSLVSPTTTTVSLTENVVRAGIDYKFGW